MSDHIFPLQEKENELFIHTYKRIPLDIDRGEGVYLYDKSGKKYLDFFSGLAVNALGYAHPEINDAIHNQTKRFSHLSNYYVTDVQIEFTEKLLKYSGMSKAFLTNSGTESVEAAVKLIRLKYGPDKKIWSLTNDFHGRTYAALSLTGRVSYQEGFEPLLPNIGQITFNDIDDLRNKVNENTAAIVLEFIQGEGGINEVSKAFIDEVETLRKKYGFVVVSDCIQCGIGRTGKPFSHNYLDFTPDMIVAAKAIGGGLPLGALLVADHLANVLTKGKHGTTFGGNSVSCAAGLVVLREVFERGLMEQVFENGKYLREKLDALKLKYPEKIKEIRGKGYMVGIDLCFNGDPIVEGMFNRGILTNCTHDTVIRLLPPLIVTKEHIDFYLMNFEEVLKDHNL